MRSFLLIILTQSLKHIVAVWKITNDDFPLYDSRMSAGVYNDSIYLIGGYFDSRRVSEFKWTTRALLTGHAQLETDISGEGQYWTQQQHILYLIVPAANDVPNNLATYNMQTNEFDYNFATVLTGVAQYGCLASFDKYIYIIGGFDGKDALNIMQILNVDTLQWLIDTPLMNDVRSAQSCIVSNDYLWTFGGGGDGNAIDTSERINVTNIMQNSWNYVDSLTNAVYETRCVSWDNIIYIIGGFDGKDYYNTVDKMNAETGFIISTDYLPDPLMANAMTPIIANAVIYGFGVKDLNKIEGIQTWIYLNLNPSSLPTDAPFIITHDPSKSPTRIPSVLPTKSPTDHPSVFLTDVPTLLPTNIPTHRPTSPPTLPPTSSSTLSPTFRPIALTTFGPSVYPIYPRKSDTNIAIIIGVSIIILFTIIIFFLSKYLDKKKKPVINEESVKKEVKENVVAMVRDPDIYSKELLWTGYSTKGYSTNNITKGEINRVSLASMEGQDRGNNNDDMLNGLKITQEGLHDNDLENDVKNNIVSKDKERDEENDKHNTNDTEYNTNIANDEFIVE